MSNFLENKQNQNEKLNILFSVYSYLYMTQIHKKCCEKVNHFKNLTFEFKQIKNKKRFFLLILWILTLRNYFQLTEEYNIPQINQIIDI